jgi:hypothetical protein
MKRLGLAILAATLIVEYAYACPPCGPSMSYTPSAPRVSPSVTVPGVGAVQSAVRDAVDFAAIKTKVRAKNPNATEDQVDAGAKKVLGQRRQRERETEDLLAREESKFKEAMLDQTLELLRMQKEALNPEPGLTSDQRLAASHILLPWAFVAVSESQQRRQAGR